MEKFIGMPDLFPDVQRVKKEKPPHTASNKEKPKENLGTELALFTEEPEVELPHDNVPIESSTVPFSKMSDVEKEIFVLNKRAENKVPLTEEEETFFLKKQQEAYEYNRDNASEPYKHIDKVTKKPKTYSYGKAPKQKRNIRKFRRR